MALAEETGDRWQRFLSQPVDGERLVTLDAGAYETRCYAAVVVVQAPASREHPWRAAVCPHIGAGLEPPDVQPWALADETGRSRWLRPQD